MADHTEWREDISSLFDRFKKLYVERLLRLQNANEAQTEDEFIKPGLELLGFEYIPQIKYKRLGQINRPDYALFPDANTKDEAYPLQDDQAKFFSRALGICEAKYWRRPLDRQTDEPGRDRFENAIPGFQIVNYLIGTEVDWGILTNGKLWRLYYQKARSRTTTYYEVDLEDILTRDEVEAFRYFYHFFNRRAFSEVDHTGKTLLERVYEGSITHAEKLGRDLKALVFEEIFIHLAEGFMEYRREELGIAEETKESLQEIFSATLRLLYRLLFILYAEARDLLPVSDRYGYYKYSLTKLKQEIAQDIMRGERLSRVPDNYWNELTALFRIIDRGDPSINVPTYNGGLFRQDHPKNAFLNQHRISDFYSAKALDLLTREQGVDSLEPRFIDYRDLGVRELGSIYEGLLEFYLRIAQQDITVVKAKGREVYVPLKEAKGRGNGRVIKEGELYLENDKHERKATGTYYTPDYIVKYIVKNTVGLVLEERTKAFEHWMEEAAEARKGLRRLRSPASIRTAREELDRLEMLALDALLDVKILDPAMGSGHFLVEAVDQLTDGIVNVLASYPDNPVLRQIERIRRDIRDNLEKQAIEVKEELLSDEKILKRMVMKRCVYGVDLNEMAVELAKLSLWLNSFTVGAPLSFLDHHLKTGNSLIGARVGEVREAVEGKAVGTGAKDDKEKVQSYLLGSRFAGLLDATELMLHLGELTDATFAEVERSASLYEEADKALRPFKRLLDLWTSEYFGNKEAQNYLRLYGDVDVFMKGDLESIPKAYRKVVRRGGEIAEEKRFFHWELEFPEVFYERSEQKKNPGFDVVVGNPPYGATFDDREKGLFRKEFGGVGRVIDSFGLFLEKACNVTRQHGRTGLIVPSGWLTGLMHKPLRGWLIARSTFPFIVHLPYDVFPDAYIDTVVAISQSVAGGIMENPGELTYVKRFGIRDDASVMATQELEYYEIDTQAWLDDGANRFLTLVGKQPRDIIDKVEKKGIDGEAVLNVSRGVTPFKQVNKMRVKGVATGLWFSLDRYGLDEQRRATIAYDPSLAEYKPPKYFRGSRMLIRRIISRQHRIHACIVHEAFVVNKSYLIALLKEPEYSLYYCLALINSRLFSKAFLWTSTIGRRDDFPQLDIATVNDLPIRRVSFTTRRKMRARLVEEGKGLMESRLERLGAAGEQETYTAFLESELGRWVSARLEAEPEQSDVIHNLLAHLAEQMIEMKKEKQAEAKTFVNWLTDHTDLPINEWHLKTYVREYWVHRWDELKRALRRNASRFGRDMESPKHQTRIKKAFEESLSRLEPLLARIQATDRLIDLIIYRLYGLTEQEVAMVEETVAK